MGIPLNNALVQNAVPYPNLNLVAIAMNVCAAPSEGAKSISLQYLFNATPCWITDLSVGIKPVSQISSMFIDASGSVTPVIIIFPDTGYQVQVAAGKALLCPVFTGKTNLPRFYVALNNGGNTTSDIVNLILLNFFIPEFAT